MNEAEDSSVVKRFVDQFWTDWEKGNHRSLAEYHDLFTEEREAISREYASLQQGIGARASKKDRMVGPYRLVSRIGRGGQGAVWLAEDTRLGRRVALKILPTSRDDNREVVERFRREARIAASLEHPNICPVYGANFDGNELYIAMKHVVGEPLSKTISRTWSDQAEPEDDEFYLSLNSAESDELPVCRRSIATNRPSRGRLLEFAKMACTVAKALHIAHEAGIVHRDIKPANIMIEDDGRPVVLDFGLARADQSMDKSLTRIGDFMGTPAFMSPEQLLANRIKLDRRTDVYSLGVSLFQCLSGVLPFSGVSSEELYNAILSRQAPDLHELNPDVPPALAAVVARSLAKDRNDRHADAAELARELEEVLAELQTDAAPTENDSLQTATSNPAALTAAQDAGPDRKVAAPRETPPPVVRGDAATQAGSWSDLRIIRELGRGGMGVVFEAEQLSLKRRVAVKVLAHHRLDESEARTRFIEEARLSSRLQHPNIVPIYNVGVEGDKLFYVMELVQGVGLDVVIRSLRAWFLDENPEALLKLPTTILDRIGLSSENEGSESRDSRDQAKKRFDRSMKGRVQRRALSWLIEAMIQVTDALAHAHRSRVVHADIKPSNLLFDSDGRLRIVDFGLARLVQDEADSNAEGPGGGTLRYMSPEQVRGDARAISPLSDVYGLGATLYELVTLQPLHGDGAAAEIVQKKLRGEIESPRSQNPGLHRDLEFVVLKALAPRQRFRYQSCSELGDDLRRFMRHEPIRSGLLGRLSGRRRKVAALTLVLLLAAAALPILTTMGNDASGDRERQLESARESMVEASGLLVGLAERERDDGRTPEEIVAGLESALERGRAALVEAGAIGAALDDFNREAGSLRVLARTLLDRPDHAWDILAALLNREIFDGRFDLSSPATKNLGTIAVRIPSADDQIIALRRLDRQLPWSHHPRLFTSAAPARFEGLIAGIWLVEIESRLSGRFIRIPIRLEAAETVEIEVPYRPDDVPEGMVYIGCHDDPFTMGDEITLWGDNDIGARTDKQLRQSLFIAVHETTNAEFFAFYKSGEYDRLVLEGLEKMGYSGGRLEILRDWWSIPINWTTGQPRGGTEQKPVSRIAFHHAHAYAEWKGCRLPAEDEWERAGRGIDGRRFVNGDRFELGTHYSPTLLSVGSMPRDVSLYGVADLAGSATEIVLSADRMGYMIRGGQHSDTNPRLVRLANDNGFNARITSERLLDSRSGRTVGFRTARTAKDLVVRKSPR